VTWPVARTIMKGRMGSNQGLDKPTEHHGDQMLSVPTPCERPRTERNMLREVHRIMEKVHRILHVLL